MAKEINNKLVKEEADLVIKNANELLTMTGDEARSLGLIERGWLAIKEEIILAVGSEETVKKAVNIEKAKEIDASGKVVAPGFIDCHTHAIFGGSRVQEYAAKATIRDPQQLEKMGIKTGVMVSVNMTREASNSLLLEVTKKRVETMLSLGTTTIEIKSGYGLSTLEEIKLLEVINTLKKDSLADIVPTFLGAHGWPEDMTKEAYIDEIIHKMLPIVKEKNLAGAQDVWIEDSHFDVKDTIRLLEASENLGLRSKVHTDAYSYIGGSDLAAEMRMMSADHLNFTPLSAIKKMANAGVVGVVMPSLDFAVNHPKPFDARPLIDEGLTLALATNLNPGNWNESLQFSIILACRLHNMSPEEAIRGATINGAKALKMENTRGSLERGKLADIQIWDIPSYEHLVYQLGTNKVCRVIKSGKVVI